VEGNGDGNGHDGQTKRRYDVEKAKQASKNYPVLNDGLLGDRYGDQRFFGTNLAETEPAANP
jgi:hypothetical protein